MKQNGLLVIDDHPVYREALKEKLGVDFAPLGVQVYGAASAHEGLDILEKEPLRWTILLRPRISWPGGSSVRTTPPGTVQAAKSAFRVH